MNVAVLGASNNPDRYSHKAVMLLKEKGHSPYPINPAIDSIEEIPAFASLPLVAVPIDVVTVYLGRANQDKIADDLLASRPQRVIFNPGAENPALARRLAESGIESIEACTLVLLKTGQFDLPRA